MTRAGGALLLSVLFLGGCASREDAAAPARPDRLPDFSGAWEKNYAASDDFDSRFSLYLFDIRRAVARNPNGGLQGSYAGGYAASMEAVVGLARFTEEITRTSILEIDQDADGIRVERDDSFALSCAWFQQAYASTVTPFGAETCGWNNGRLVFAIDLDELSIRHQLSLSPDRGQLNLTTTVQSGAVSTPFTISSFYDRYVRPVEDFDCVLTLSRYNVCTRTGSR